MNHGRGPTTGGRVVVRGGIEPPTIVQGSRVSVLGASNE
jgi:hypothetical protein